VNILPFDRQVAVIAALCEGMSIRSVERLTGVHRDTIMRLGVRVGGGCARLHDYFMCDLNVASIELDELWSFVAKKQRHLKPEDSRDKGDAYTFIALDAVNKAIIGYRVGKRDSTTTAYFVSDLRARVMGSPVISSDAMIAYADAVRFAFRNRVHYGQVVKHYTPGPAVVEAARRYSPPAVVEVKREVIFGRIEEDQICTSHVERLNLSVRMASRRFTRLTNAFSKKLENHAAAVSLFVGHYNFCRVHEALRITPAMALGVTDHIWGVDELLRGAIEGTVRPQGRRVGRFRVIDGGAT
jgi:IS1 family transposase